MSESIADDAMTTTRPEAWPPADEEAADARASGREAASPEPPVPPVLWIGFTELEAWAEALDPSRPALLLPVVQPTGHDAPFQTERLLVACQQVTPDGHVLYCHLLGATLTRVCGEIVDADWRRRAMAWESLWECVEACLEERGLAVLPATVACPKDWALLLDHAGGIAYDKAARRFRRVHPAWTP